MQTAKSCSHFDKANTHLDKDSDRELCARGREPMQLSVLASPDLHSSHASRLSTPASQSFSPNTAIFPYRYSNFPLLALQPFSPSTPIFPYWYSSLF